MDAYRRYYVPCHAGWVGPTVLLCIYGFCSMMRPIEPFVTVFLTGTYKNLTTEQVTSQVIPVWTYSRAVLLVPVLLITDFLRYKPVIVLQSLTYVTAECCML
uniref:Solute carrier family 19 member 1 n=1 Tax=Amphiprion ocellaris TaxID=80972 RepID=A0AAQ5Y710_AMPOC